MKRFDVLHKAVVVKAVVPGLAAVSLVGTMALGAGPARAGSLGEDAAVGGAVGAGVGLILNGRTDIGDAANGAAAGVACHVADEEFQEGDDRNLAQDLAVGAATAGGLGLIINDDNTLLENAAQGAAACGAINVIDNID